MTRPCTTHHHACACCEEHIADLERQLAEARVALAAFSGLVTIDRWNVRSCIYCGQGAAAWATDIDHLVKCPMTAHAPAIAKAKETT